MKLMFGIDPHIQVRQRWCVDRFEKVHRARWDDDDITRRGRARDPALSGPVYVGVLNVGTFSVPGRLLVTSSFLGRVIVPPVFSVPEPSRM